MIPRIKEDQDVAIKEYQRQHNLLGGEGAYGWEGERIKHAISYPSQQRCFVTPPILDFLYPSSCLMHFNFCSWMCIF